MNVQSKDFSISLEADRAALTSLRLEAHELIAPGEKTPLFSLVALDEENQRIRLFPQGGRQEGEALVFDRLIGERSGASAGCADGAFGRGSTAIPPENHQPGAIASNH